jgi:hypothetical protein
LILLFDKILPILPGLYLEIKNRLSLSSTKVRHEDLSYFSYQPDLVLERNPSVFISFFQYTHTHTHSLLPYTRREERRSKNGSDPAEDRSIWVHMFVLLGHHIKLQKLLLCLDLVYRRRDQGVLGNAAGPGRPKSLETRTNSFFLPYLSAVLAVL